MPKKNKREAKESEEKTEKKEQERKTEREKQLENQIKWIIFIFVLIGVAFFTWYAVSNYVPTVKWNNFTFYRTKIGNESVWTSNITIPTAKPLTFQLFLRHSPNELESIPANVSGTLYKEVYISYSPEILECNDSNSVIGAIVLTQFLAAIGASPHGAVSAPSEKFGYNESSIINCSDAVKRTVFIVERANETRIYPAEHSNCWIIEVKDCQVMSAFERYITAKISDILESIEKQSMKANQTNITNETNQTGIISSNSNINFSKIIENLSR